MTRLLGMCVVAASVLLSASAAVSQAPPSDVRIVVATLREIPTNLAPCGGVLGVHFARARYEIGGAGASTMIDVVHWCPEVGAAGDAGTLSIGTTYRLELEVFRPEPFAGIQYYGPAPTGPVWYVRRSSRVERGARSAR